MQREKDGVRGSVQANQRGWKGMKLREPNGFIFFVDRGQGWWTVDWVSLLGKVSACHRTKSCAPFWRPKLLRFLRQVTLDSVEFCLSRSI